MRALGTRRRSASTMGSSETPSPALAVAMVLKAALEMDLPGALAGAFAVEVLRGVLMTWTASDENKPAWSRGPGRGRGSAGRQVAFRFGRRAFSLRSTRRPDPARRRAT